MGLFILGAPQAGLPAQTGWTGQANSAAAGQPAYEVTLTGYNAVPAQTDSDPLTTASGAYSDPDVVAARSLDLADELPFGTVIAVEPSATSTYDCGLALVGARIGLRVIADSMNPRMHNKVDILFDTEDTVEQWGMQRNAAKALGFCRGAQIRVVGHIDVTRMPKNQIELSKMLGKSASLAVNK